MRRPACLLGLVTAVAATSTAATVKIGLLVPYECGADLQDECNLVVKAATIAAADFVAQEHVTWHPELVRTYPGSSNSSSSSHSRRASTEAGSGIGVHETYDAMCNEFKVGVAGFIGPLTTQEAVLVAPLAGWHQVPIISPAANAQELGDRSIYPYFRRTIPSTVAQGDAIAEYIRALGWKRLGVLYDRNEGSAKSLMRSVITSFAHFEGKVAYVESIESGKDKAYYQPILRHIRENYVQAIAVLGSSKLVASIIEAALDPDHPPALFGGGRVWFTSEETADQLVGIEHLWHQSTEWGCDSSTSHDANTSFCHCDKCQEHLDRVSGLMSVALPVNYSEPHMVSLAAGLHTTPQKIDLYERTAYDATYALLKALQETGAWQEPYTSSRCSRPATQKWSRGPEVLKYLDENPFDGAAGHMDFAQLESDFEHDLINLQRDSAHKHHWAVTGRFLPRSDWPASETSAAAPTSSGHGRAAWELATSTATTTNSTVQLKVAVSDGSDRANKYCTDCAAFEWPGDGTPPDSTEVLRGLHLHALAIEVHPYMHFLHPPNVTCIGVDPVPDGCFEGVLWDVMVDFMKRFQFSIDVQFVNGTEDDAIAELSKAHGEYEILIGNLAITEARLQKVDFTQPLFETETVLVTHHAPAKDPAWFHFMEPFTGGMWGCVLALICVNAFVFYWLERGVNDQVVQGHAGAEGALYYSFTAFLFTADGSPATRGGRIITVGFYFTALIALSTYTAQLTVFLLQRNPTYEFTSFNSFMPGLGKRTMEQIIVEEGSLEHAWACATCSCCTKPGSGPTTVGHSTANEQDKRIKGLMTAKGCLPNNASCPLAVLIEKHLATHHINQDPTCSLVIHPSAGKGINNQGDVPALEHFGLGIALRKGSVYTSVLSQEILHLKEHHTIQELQNKWFPSTCTTVGTLTVIAQTRVRDFIGMYIIFGALVLITLSYKRVFRLLGLGVDLDGDGKVDDLVNKAPLERAHSRRGSFVDAGLSRLIKRVERLLNSVQADGHASSDGRRSPRMSTDHNRLDVPGARSPRKVQVSAPDAAGIPPLPPVPLVPVSSNGTHVSDVPGSVPSGQGGCDDNDS